MWLICGLGNPGSKYEGTPHNLGFELVDLLVQRHSLEWQDARRFKCLLASASFQGEKLHLMKPQTFMNLSGEALAAFAKYYAIPPERCLVVCDDVALPYGKLRLRENGTHGGHNGLRNIQALLNTTSYPRLRIGCAPERPVPDLAGYVLSPIWGEGRELAPLALEMAADCIEFVLRHGTQKAMSKYNAWDGRTGA